MMTRCHLCQAAERERLVRQQMEREAAQLAQQERKRAEAAEAERKKLEEEAVCRAGDFCSLVTTHIHIVLPGEEDRREDAENGAGKIGKRGAAQG